MHYALARFITCHVCLQDIFQIIIVIIIIRQPLCPVVGRRPLYAVSKLPCLGLSFVISCSSSICPSRLATAWLVSLVTFSCHGLQLLTREGHRSSLRRLICPAQDHFIFLTLFISMTFVLTLTQMLVFISLYVMLSILLSILVLAAGSLFWVCLVSVQVSAPYVIAGSTQDMYTCLFRQIARLPSIFVCDVEHTSFHFGLCGRKFVLGLFGQCPGPVFMSRS